MTETESVCDMSSDNEADDVNDSGGAESKDCAESQETCLEKRNSSKNEQLSEDQIERVSSLGSKFKTPQETDVGQSSTSKVAKIVPKVEILVTRLPPSLHLDFKCAMMAPVVSLYNPLSPLADQQTFDFLDHK